MPTNHYDTVTIIHEPSNNAQPGDHAAVRDTKISVTFEDDMDVPITPGDDYWVVIGADSERCQLDRRMTDMDLNTLLKFKRY